jgi:hypothetical protein
MKLCYAEVNFAKFPNRSKMFRKIEFVRKNLICPGIFTISILICATGAIGVYLSYVDFATSTVVTQVQQNKL